MYVIYMGIGAHIYSYGYLILNLYYKNQAKLQFYYDNNFHKLLIAANTSLSKQPSICFIQPF